MPSKPIRVLVADDHAVVRSGLSAFLMAFDDLELVGEAANGAEALELCNRLKPDVVLMDMVMPVMDGAAATKAIRERHPEIQILALTSFKEQNLVQSALKAGAIGYLLKDLRPNALADAIRAAHTGRPTLAPEAAQVLIDATVHEPTQTYTLTDREMDVLALMVKGLSNNKIADHLQISPSTVKFHVSNVLSKLDAASRTEAVALALKQGLLKKN